MRVPILMVRAFTCETISFSGNPAAIIIQQQCNKNGVFDEIRAEAVPLSDKYKQQIASEMNLSETAFISCCNSTKSVLSADVFKLQWFTPTNEVNLCGHATLASAAALNAIGCSTNEITFETLSGTLFTRYDSGKARITLDFPSNLPEPLTEKERAELDGLIRAIVGNMDVIDVHLSRTAQKLLVHMNNSCDVRGVQPSPGSVLLSHANLDGMVRGVIVTASSTDSDDKYDFISRYFSPWNGIEEDPVTGSAHTVLAPYWSNILGKTELRAHQASPRGGDLWLVVRTDGRVDISGAAQVVYTGTYQLY